MNETPDRTGRDDEATALRLDRDDPLRAYREAFHLPRSPAIESDPDTQAIYLCGNSLGCMPRDVRGAIECELDDWATLGVDAHHDAANPWLPYHEVFREMGARLVGALPGEVVMMNSLTVNLHLMMVSFYRPTPERFRIVIESDAFPSDSYAVASQAAYHGFDPAEAVVRIRPRDGESCVRTQDVVGLLEEIGESVALVLMGGVNYLNGQWFDMQPITAAAKAAGAVVGWDLAHAAGNVPLALHAWEVDFAAWCSYKYLNSGPGAVAGCFVHEQHAQNITLPRFAGWWGNDPKSRFEMVPHFQARPGADGWQLSNPPILAMAPLKASLEIFDRVGMDQLREKSLRLTGFLASLLARIDQVSVMTPEEPSSGPFGGRGCQLSITVPGNARTLHGRLHEAGVVGDFREPNVIRVAPVPLYNSFHDVWRFARRLAACVADLDATSVQTK